MGSARPRCGYLRHDRARWPARDLDAVPAVLPVVSAAWVAVESIERGQQIATTGALEVLGARERDVAVFAARGMRTGEIALILGTSPHTVRNQLSRIFEKLGVSSRVELTALVLASE